MSKIHVTFYRSVYYFMKRLVFLIDDDEITHALVKGAIDQDLSLISAYSLAEANKLLDQDVKPEIVIIDRVLPDGDGLAICSKLRAHPQLKDVPIIFFSSQGGEMDKVGGLFAGADDYISKPVSPLELKARIQARLRAKSRLISVGKLSLDLTSHRVFLDGNEIDLTRIEFKILVTLAENLDRVFSRDHLLSAVWGATSNVTDRVVDTHLSHLRKKLSGAGVKIEALRGEGYRLVLNPQEGGGHAA